jgi:hypothetical protein
MTSRQYTFAGISAMQISFCTMQVVAFPDSSAFIELCLREADLVFIKKFRPSLALCLNMLIKTRGYSAYGLLNLGRAGLLFKEYLLDAECLINEIYYSSSRPYSIFSR